ncbi:MAG TPA: helix-turn-helix domain-containing protein [Actinomycetota bacterium]|nr:helix-turn-helix domain-containing protein [Actinomycetota bacterium]
MEASQALRHARRAAGFSQRDLAARAGVAQPAIARIETGRVVPRVDTLDRLLRACGRALEVGALYGEGIDPTAIRELLKLTPKERLELAAQEANNLAHLLVRAQAR